MNLKVIDLTCPSCGATLDASSGSETITCEYCGTSFAVSGAARKAKVEQPAQAEVAYAAPSVEPTQTKRKTWLWVLGWIFCFPIPLTILMLNSPRTKGINSKARIAIVVVGWLLYLAIAFSGGGTSTSATNEGSSTDTESSNDITTVVTQKETREGWRDVYAFIDEFNAGSGMTITDTVEVDNISNKDNEYYRVEYRLGAFDNAVAVIGQIEGYGQIDILCYGNMGYSDIRVYADANDRDQAAVMFEAIANILVTGDDRENIAKGVEDLKDSSITSPSLYLGSKYSAGYAYEEVMVDARK